MRHFLFIVMLIALSSCGSDDSKGKVKLLSVKDIYKRDSVSSMMERSNYYSKTIGSNYYLMAARIYKRNRMSDSIYYYLKHSIAANPTAQSYFFMGNVCHDKKKYDEGLEAYQMASYLKYEPEAALHYSIARTYGAMGDIHATNESLNSALLTGFSDKAELMRDPAFAEYRHTDDFKNLMITYFKDDEKKKELFESYAQKFKEVSLPFVIGYPIIDSFGYHGYDKIDMSKNIDYNYSSFVEGLAAGYFGRMMSLQFSYVAKVSENEKYTSLIYASADALGDTLQPVNLYLITYDKYGNQIDKITVACRRSADEGRIAVISENGFIETSDYRNEWAQNPIDKGYRGNKILASKVISKGYFSLSEDGHFTKREQKDPVSASSQN